MPTLWRGHAFARRVESNYDRMGRGSADAISIAVALPLSGKAEAETMKTKTWTVVANTGKQADLAAGLEKIEIQKPPHISSREFIHWLAPASHVDDTSLRSLFKL